ncbi:hypothetical protein V2J09_013702 [Rumex salicifolius]
MPCASLELCSRSRHFISLLAVGRLYNYSTAPFYGILVRSQQMSLPFQFSISLPQSLLSLSSHSKSLIFHQTLTFHSPPVSRLCTTFSALTFSDPSRNLRCLCQRSIPSFQFNEISLNRIFIKGLSKSTSEGSLRKAFSQFGDVAHVKIILDNQTKESLGFAYLVFSNEEDAQLAIKAMDGKFFEGRFIYVTNAKPGTIKPRAKANPYKF